MTHLMETSSPSFRVNSGSGVDFEAFIVKESISLSSRSLSVLILSLLELLLNPFELLLSSFVDFGSFEGLIIVDDSE